MDTVPLAEAPAGGTIIDALTGIIMNIVSLFISDSDTDSSESRGKDGAKARDRGQLERDQARELRMHPLEERLEEEEVAEKLASSTGTTAGAILVVGALVGLLVVAR